ncbi:FtsX-like permease family protein [Janibacter indicus]
MAAKGGPADRLRRRLMAGCAALAMVPAGLASGIPAVNARGWQAGDYGLALLRDGELALGAGFAMALLALPVVLLALECSRVGSSGRDRRLAAMRAAGATRGDVRRVIAVEASAMTALGVIVGTILVLAAWALLARWHVGGLPLLPPGVWPRPTHLLTAMTLVVLIGAVMAWWVAGRIRVGVAGQQRVERRVSGARAVFLVVVAGLAGGAALVVSDSGMVNLAVSSTMALTALVALVAALSLVAPLSTRALGSLVGRGGSAVALLAGRGMAAHPARAGRAASGLVLVGLVGGALATYGGALRAGLRETLAAGHTWGGDSTAFYLVPLTLAEVLLLVVGMLGVVGLLVAVAEQVVVRRGALGRQHAAGVPLPVLRRVMVLETTLPVAVVGLLSTLVGMGVAGLLVAQVPENPFAVDWWLVAGVVVLMTGGTAAAAWVASARIVRAADVAALRDGE